MGVTSLVAVRFVPIIPAAILLLHLLTSSEAWLSPTTPASRREAMVTIGSLVAGGVTLPPAAVDAEELDYSKVQDLLGGTAIPYVPEGKRPTYLTEPTDEFRENESKSAEFKRQNMALKAKFNSVLNVVATGPNQEETLASALDDMRRQVRANGGLPSGISKEEVVKTCRRRKAQRYWPTNVEIA